MAVSLFLSLCAASVLAAFIYYWLHRRYTYWARRGVPYLQPDWLYGNLTTVGRTTTLREPFRELYGRYKGQALFGGFYLSFRKAAVLLDLDLIKQVLIKDFNNFAHRGNYYNEKDDPLSANLFNLNASQWYEMRKKLTPTFTSLKISLMQPAVLEIAHRFVSVLRQKVTTSEASGSNEAVLDLKEFLACFTTDVIGSCVFGLDCNSLMDPHTEFRVMGERTFHERRHCNIVVLLMNAFPSLAGRLHMKSTADDVSEFFTRVLKQTISHRDQHKIKRNDFLNLLMELRSEDGDMDGLTFEQIVAQSFIFFVAGFETSSGTMGFALYELARHVDIQNKARAEVQAVYEKHGGKLSYEALMDLKYIQQLLYETMRCYSIASVHVRMAINDYQVPGTKDIIEAGIPVIIPVDSIHHDPAIYPNPDVFDPERFTPEAIESRHNMAWLPFGAGPRNCIALRFGKMLMIIGLAVLLKNFTFTLAKDMPIPLEMDTNSFALTPKSSLRLNVQRIN